MEVLGKRATVVTHPAMLGAMDVDAEVFGSFIDEMGEDAGPAIHQFIADVERRFAEMGAASHRAEVVERDSHAIKSAAGLLGLKRLAQLAAELEAQCRSDRDARFGAQVVRMRTAFDAARSALQAAA
jgi:HPt (histidine-containing phosphotransfer) domain-containing protein